MAIQKLNGRAGFSINHPPVDLIDNAGNYTTTTGDVTAVNFYGNWEGINNDRFIENLQTGILYGGVVSINAGNSSKFDISAGSGIIVTQGASLTALPNPTVTTVTWTAKTAVTLTNLASADETWIAINSSGAVVQQTSTWTETQYETQIPLGALVHPNRSTINIAKSYPHVSYGQASQIDPFVRAFGPLKLSGYEISANGANLQVNKSSGKAYAIGRNYKTDPNSPNIVTDTNSNPVTAVYRWYRNGSGGFTTVVNSTIDPTKWDDGTGTLQSVSGGQYTTQRLFALPNQPEVLGVYYGRQTYTSFETAQANIQYESFSENDATATQGVFLGYLIVKGNATALNNTANAKFIAAGLFRNTSNIGGGGVAYSVIDDFADVTITSPANNNLLRYDSSTSQWINSTINSLNIATITGTETLTNKTLVTPNIGAATATSISGTNLAINNSTGAYVSIGEISSGSTYISVDGNAGDTLVSAGNVASILGTAGVSILDYGGGINLDSSTGLAIGDVSGVTSGEYLFIDPSGYTANFNGISVITPQISSSNFISTVSGIDISYSFSATLTTTTTSTLNLLQLDKASIRGAKFIIQAVNTTGGKYQLTEINAIHNGNTTVSTATISDINIGGANATYAVDIGGTSSTKMRLRVTPTSTQSTVFKVYVRDFSL